MSEVTVSSKYQVVIPKEVRCQVDLTPGQKLQVMIKGGTVIPGADNAGDVERDGYKWIPGRGRTRMILVDSCGWLEFLADGPLAQAYAAFRYEGTISVGYR